MTSSRNFSITEPHPSVPSNQYTAVHWGRGGAGNVTRVSSKEVTSGPTATGPASRVKLPSPPTSGQFLTGRGGAGNVHRERAIFSFDEELRQQQRLQEAASPIYHVGRGGSGNFIDESKSQTSRKGSASSTFSNDSVDSVKSAPHKARRSYEGARNWLNRTLSAR
ncbi:hypothetical protein GTA08_BOTSDO11038 [Neofusicoccum parvum]|uniref:Uncharacterized protein n=2 Tax=Neofusicoccum parvum TaxID=310453 RepID=R1GC52_BOTPV|nr:hypothetical protein UCRNP2_7439 [Neofusicoccum parvum UCRNP2]GME25695.1 hypothetical protein GTA08_BOTSDO11038 [Neofusicoccum parvum]GME32429.1 hypothetical protein GTA08_BOTSDO11038 [Neofusicoccum parvum]